MKRFIFELIKLLVEFISILLEFSDFITQILKDLG